MKRVALYLRASTLDQHPETQLCDLRQMAAQRGYEIVREFTDQISGTKARRPGLDQLMADARRGQFDLVLVWAFDRIARSVVHFPSGARRAQLPGRRIRQLQGERRHRWPVGPGHRRDRCSDRGTRTILDRRKSARWNAACQTRGPPHRPPAARSKPRGDPSGSPQRTKPRPDRKGTPHQPRHRSQNRPLRNGH